MTAKQFFKLIVVIIFAYCAAYFLIYFLNGKIKEALDELVSASLAILTVIGAMSFAMFTYVDNMAKDLTDLRNDVNREKYLLAHSRLSSVKREVLANVALVVFFFVFERAIKFFANYAEQEHFFVNEWLLKTASVSLRFSFLVLAVWATAAQLMGFLIAVQYRELIATNRK